MAMTIAEKILARACGKKTVEPGDLINAEIDVMLGNDVTAPVAINEFRKHGFKKIADPDKVILVMDHFVPNKDIKSANQVKLCRDFAREFAIKHYYDVGCMGIEHVLLPEQGLVTAGELIIGADSHTCTYGALGSFATGVGSTDLAAAWATGQLWFKVPETIKFVYTGQLPQWVFGKDLILYTIGQIGVDGALYQAMEFTGPVIEKMDMDGRFTMCNMAIEAGGKTGIVPFDTITQAYIEQRKKKNYTIYQTDPDAHYAKVFEWDISKLEPQVAFPHLPENSKPVSQAKGIRIDQAVIGSCTNGRISDLRIAASILKDRKVAPGVRCIILPGTPEVYKQANKEGLIDIFMDAQAVVSTPTCGPCLGGYMGILASGERAISTTNRNFVGRMGDPKSEVYLSNPAVAAASALAGEIVHPEEV